MILAINTSTFQLGLALLKEEGTLIAEVLLSAGTKHFGGLMPSLHFLLTSSGAKLADLQAVVVATGPGSYTGLRVGLSASMGLCHSLKIPIIGISSLAALASRRLFTDLPISSLLDSRRGEFFMAQFLWRDEHELVRKQKDRSVKVEELASYVHGPTVFIGNDFASQASVIRRFFSTEAHLAPSHLWNLKASSVAFLGLKRYIAGDFDDPYTLNPVYLRPPDIRPNPFLLPADM